MKIISLQTENIKCLKAVEIAPGGESLEIAGKNGQGKSSVLDSIFYALGGKAGLCERPIRDGESSAKIVVELDDYTVTRTFTAAGGGTLKVVPRDENAKISSPQAVLDGLVGALTFDPLEFTRQKNQAEILRRLVGLDTSAIEAEHAKIYQERTEINRELSAISSVIGNQVIKELPTVETDVKDILAARSEGVKRNDAIHSALKVHEDVSRMINQTRREIDAQTDLIGVLENQLVEAKKKMSLLEVQFIELNNQRAVLILPPLEDLSSFDNQVLSAQTTNAAIRANNALREYFESRDRRFKKSAELTKRLDDLTAQKYRMVAEAKYPIQGLGFSSTGSVTFNGIPFEQISAAQKLQISAAIGMALNPKLRVMMIRDGSLLDTDSLNLLKSVAAAHNAQLWIERVGKLTGELPGVVIEDGSIIESTLPANPRGVAQ